MKKYLNKDIILSGIFSLLLSFGLLLESNIKFHQDAGVNFIKQFHFGWKFFLLGTFLAVPCFIGLKILLYFLSKIKFKSSEKQYSKPIFCSIAFIGILISGLLFLLTFYPGSNMNDTLNIIYNPIGVSYQHPLLYNLGLSYTYRLFFKIFHSMNFAYFCTGVVQILIIDTILTYLLWWFHKTFKNKPGTILLTIYFIFIPITSNYYSVLIKDSLFAGVLLLHIPLLYELIHSKGAWLEHKSSIIKTILLFSATTLIRNNGLYIILFMLLILTFSFKKYKRQWGIIFIFVLLLYEIPTTYSKKKVMEPLFQEKSGILIQQISYVIHNNEKISSKDQKYLNQIMNLETWKGAYNPFNVDAVKWHPSFESIYLTKTKSTFIKTWLHLLPTHFESYIKSYLLTTYGLWSIDRYIPEQGTFLGLDLSDSYSVKPFPDLHQETIFPKNLQHKLTHFYKNTTKFLNNGSCFWILILFILLCLHTKKKELLLLSTPLIGVWLTLMISSPISYALRYMVSYVFLLPFFFFIITSYQKKDS